MENRSVRTIVMYPRPQPDTIGAYFLLREFGEEAFPGIREAQLLFWNQVPPGKTTEQLESEGHVLIDLGGGKFDHHRNDHDEKTETASTLVGKFLGVIDYAPLRRFFSYVKRDDLQGKGTVSKDVIDRAFGLSAIIVNLNRDYPDHPDYVVEIGYRIFLAQFHEEYRRKVLMPQEWLELQKTGKATRFDITTSQRSYHVVLAESDSSTLAGFLRAIKEVQADIVVQRRTSGHTNIITNQNKGQRVSLQTTIHLIRLLEAKRKNLDISQYGQEQLRKPGRIPGLEEWFYDNAANTIQNGGASPEGVIPTRITLEEMKHILEKTIPLAEAGD